MDENKGNYDIYQEFFEDWTKEQISVIVIIIQNIDMEKSPEIRSSYVDSIHRIIYGHNMRIKNIIQRVQSGMI
jgi:hypothetical protein